MGRWSILRRVSTGDKPCHGIDLQRIFGDGRIYTLDCFGDV